jgi:hypothetical protein
LFFDHLGQQAGRQTGRQPGQQTAQQSDHQPRGGPGLADQPPDHTRNDTLASLLLANLTTVVSFGLLASSSVGALSAIGQVVAPGALLALLLSASFMAPRRAGSRPATS